MAARRNLRFAFVVALVAASVGYAAVPHEVGAAGSATAPPKDKPYQQQQNIVYGEADGVGLVLDLFTPTGPKNGIGIVDIVSGAYYSDRGKIEQHRRAKFYDIFCGRGYTVFAIRPGSVSKFAVPEMLAHIQTGVKWVREHAAQYGVDPDRLGITGASAGGHLACLTVVTAVADAKGENNQPFKAAGIFFPPTDFSAWGGIMIDYTKDDRFSQMVHGLAIPRADREKGPLSKQEMAERVRKISPARLIQGKQPPFLIYHGDADPLVPLQQSKVFVEALKKAGGSAELVIKPGGMHPWPTIPEEVKLMADWFDRQLLKPAK